MIFAPSMPQSGTWFLLRFLEKCDYKLEHVGEILRRKENRVMDRAKPTVLHTHIFPFYHQCSAFKEAWPSFGGDPVQEYVVRRYNVGINTVELFASLYKTVIPIRDPLNCLLTRETRAPNLRHFYITDGFIEVANRFKDHPNVEFLPVDLYKSISDRENALRRILTHCGIDTEKYKDVVETTANEWKRENSISTNRYREPYENGDIDKIKEMLGEKWAEVEHLKIHGATIIPLLKKLGYNKIRQLLW